MALAANMSKFRSLLQAHVVAKAKVMIGTPPLSAVNYRRKVVQLFCARGRHAVETLVALALFPNGDWRNENAVEMPPKFGPRLVQFNKHTIKFD